MTREEQTAKILKNGFRYKGKKMTWFKIQKYSAFCSVEGNTFWVDSATGRAATKVMRATLNEYRERYPTINLEIIFAGIYDKKLMEGLR